MVIQLEETVIWRQLALMSAQVRVFPTPYEQDTYIIRHVGALAKKYDMSPAILLRDMLSRLTGGSLLQSRAEHLLPLYDE